MARYFYLRLKPDRTQLLGAFLTHVDMYPVF